MKKKSLGFLVLGIFTVLVLGSCELFAALVEIAKYSVSGKAVNVKASGASTSWWQKDSSTTLVGATITFDDLSSTTNYTGTVGSNGTYTIAGVPNGKYTITGNKSGWTFVPINFTVSGYSSTAPDLMAYPTTDAGALTFILAWGNSSYDVDFHMTYGAETDNNINHLYYNTLGLSKVTGSGLTATLDRDVRLGAVTSIPRVETITISGTPLSSESLRFYAHVYAKGSAGVSSSEDTAAPYTLTGDSSGNIASADAAMYVMLGTSHFGTYYLPYNTAERTLRIARLDVANANPNFTVYTDTQSVGSGNTSSPNLRSVDSETVQTIGVEVDSIR